MCFSRNLTFWGITTTKHLNFIVNFRSNPLTSEKVLVKGSCIASPKKKQSVIPRVASVNDLAQSIRPSTQTSGVMYVNVTSFIGVFTLYT